jgi:hypothetical protein
MAARYAQMLSMHILHLGYAHSLECSLSWNPETYPRPRRGSQGPVAPAPGSRR